MSDYQDGSGDLFDEEDDPSLTPITNNTRFRDRQELLNSRSRLRSWINRDAAASERRSREIANHLIYSNNVPAKKKKGDAAIVHALSSLAGKVLNSTGITPAIKVTSSQVRGRGVHAYTDFQNINIDLNAANFNLKDTNSVAELIHVVKGLVYHEGGHIMWTTSLPKLCAAVKCNGKHLFKGDIIKGHVDDEVLNDMLGGLANGTHSCQMAWNILEDQRMESLMVTMSPVMSRYFSTIVAKYVINAGAPGISWPWLTGRKYLPKDLRLAILAEAQKHKYASLITVIDDIVMRYRKSRDVHEMHQCVVKMGECMAAWTHGLSLGDRPKELDRHDYSSGSSGNGVGKIYEAPDIKDPEEGTSGSGEDNDGNSERSDESADSKSDSENEQGSENDNDKSSGSRGGDDAGHDEPNRSIDDLLNDVIKSGEQSVTQDEINSFIGDINDLGRLIAVPDPSIRAMNSRDVSASAEVTASMINVLDSLVVQVDPTWQFYRDDGVLDPTAFLTRDPGDMNFWSGLDGAGSNGHDLAVSLLIDSSGSMDGDIRNVSIIAMGIRKACEYFDIPCTITTFSDTVYLVAAGDQPTGHVEVEAGGGTHIFDAMSILKDQRYGKTYHLVFILTDGEWSDIKDIRMWGDTTRNIVLVGLNLSREALINRGANTVITITDPKELAPLVTSSLVGYFAS